MTRFRQAAWLAVALAAGPGLPAPAQGPEPAQDASADAVRLTAEISDPETPVGQPLVLTIKVLVPGWMPKPPEFPDLEQPGLMVRLPERASGPVSETVAGETWSGVQRRYRLYPLRGGCFELSGLSVTLHAAGPGQPAPQNLTAARPELSFTALLPEAARGLDPPILAQGLRLSETLEGAERLEVGGAVVRVVTARIEGTTPVLIPALIPALFPEPAPAIPDEPAAPPALRAYPDEPQVTESEERGTLSGSRRERVSYVATAAGCAELPAIRIAWFNLQSGQVETAELPAHPLTIAPGPAAPARSGTDRAGGGRGAGAGALAAWHGSEPHARGRLRAAIRRRDLGASHAALRAWTCRAPKPRR